MKKGVVKKIIFSFIILVSLFVFFGPRVLASSATLRFDPSAGKYFLGDTIRVKVLAESGVSINAIAGRISFPSDLLSLDSFSKDESMVDLWAQDIIFSNYDGVVSFEGIIIDGFKGTAGEIFTLVFKTKALGTANLKFEKKLTLASDGEGTTVPSSTTGASFEIVANENVPLPEEKCPAVATPGEKENAKLFFFRLDRCSYLVFLGLALILLLLLLVFYLCFRILKFERLLEEKLAELAEREPK